MIPLLIIILLVIWLIIKVRRQAEYYKVEGLKLSWANKANIEGNVSKWIFVLKDKSGNEIHRYENNEAGNLKDWTNVSVDVIGKKEFDEKIIGDNTLEIYYNDAEESKKLYTTTVNYSESDFSGTIDTNNLEEVQEFKPAFSYEFIMNKKNQTLGIHVEYIKLDGVLATKEQTTIHKNPNRNNKPDNMFSIGSGTQNYASWNANGHNVGDKIFTIESDKQIEKIDIAYTRPRYAPGWIIKENGVAKITETSNRGNNMTPRPVVYTYNIKDGTTPSPPPPPITEIPHQIDGGSDGWCNHGNSVHQDVPGCGRICSDSNTVGRKDKGTWGSWNAYPGSVECPAAKLDQVWKMEGNSRKLAVGDYSRGHVALDTSGGFKWYYYQGSYLSVPSSFNNKEPSAEGTGARMFSSKHMATGGYLPHHGNKSNYGVRWQGRFVPKQTGAHHFWTESDDMSYLYVDYKKVVDNGGLHGMVKKKGKYNMTKGKEYLIEIFFSEKGGGDEIKVWFKGPGMSSATHDFTGYMVKDTKICSSEMFGGKKNKGITDYKHCLECAHKWEPGLHKRSINCENIWLDD
tara:strand:- start:2353 stop:4065 length:1713 start_codon:yes stop_codon:yes gene_type:complete